MNLVRIRKLLTLIIFFVQLANASDVVSKPVVIDSDHFQGILANSGDFYIAGQPTKKGLLELKKLGVTRVISLRTAHEMDDRDIVPFDENAFVTKQGLIYINIPLGGKDNKYTPEALEVFAQAVNESQGKILVHCTVGWRASHMWAAYLHRYKKLSLDEAIANASEINFDSYGTSPMKKLLGLELQ